MSSPAWLPMQNTTTRVPAGRWRRAGDVQEAPRYVRPGVLKSAASLASVYFYQPQPMRRLAEIRARHPGVGEGDRGLLGKIVGGGQR